MGSYQIIQERIRSAESMRRIDSHRTRSAALRRASPELIQEVDGMSREELQYSIANLKKMEDYRALTTVYGLLGDGPNTRKYARKTVRSAINHFKYRKTSAPGYLWGSGTDSRKDALAAALNSADILGNQRLKTRLAKDATEYLVKAENSMLFNLVESLVAPVVPDAVAWAKGQFKMQENATKLWILSRK